MDLLLNQLKDASRKRKTTEKEIDTLSVQKKIHCGKVSTDASKESNEVSVLFCHGSHEVSLNRYYNFFFGTNIFLWNKSFAQINSVLRWNDIFIGI